MKTIVTLASFRWVLVLAFALCVALVAGSRGGPRGVERGDWGEGLFDKSRVKVVQVIHDDGPIKAKRVKIKKNEQVVVWYTNGKELKIEWKGTDPFKGRVVCEGRFCVALTPSATEGTFTYRAIVDGQPSPDPEVEVEP